MWISGKVADHAKLQYIKLLDNNKLMEQMRKFDVNKDRADEFYMNIFSDVLPLAELKEVVKVCLILSHGNARVESGFSINQLILDVNIKMFMLISNIIKGTIFSRTAYCI